MQLVEKSKKYTYCSVEAATNLCVKAHDWLMYFQHELLIGSLVLGPLCNCPIAFY